MLYFHLIYFLSWDKMKGVFYRVGVSSVSNRDDDIPENSCKRA